MNLKEFQNLDEQSVSEWYEENEKTFKTIEKLIFKDLTGFADKTGLHRIAYFESRIKSKNSLWEKIQKFNEGKNRDLIKQLKQRKLDRDNFSIQDIINDMIGVRLVFYFEPDLPSALIYFLTYPIYSTVEIKVYDFLNANLNHPFNVTTRLVDIAKLYERDTKKASKSSGYESVHIITKYNGALLEHRMRTSKSSVQISTDLLNNLSLFPIEIQIRTILQHGWAQIEHTYNYAEKKKVISYPNSNNGNADEDFIMNKFISRSVENHQNQIWAKHWSRSAHEGKVSKETVPYGDRFQDFSKPDQSKLTQLYKVIIPNITNLSSEHFQDVISLIKELDLEYHFIAEEVPVEWSKWSQRRSILLLLGYIALYNKSSSIEIELLEAFELFSMRMTDDHWINLIALYEYIKKIDSYFRVDKDTGEERLFFFDPLVSYRAAGVHYITGNPRRAIGLMQDAVKERNKNISGGLSKKTTSSSVINKMHFKRRIAEYYWRAYNQDNRTSNSDLENAQFYISESYYEKDKANESNLKSEKRKILSKIIIFNLYACILETGVLNMKSYSEIISEYEGDISDLLIEDELTRKDNGSLGLEALSIYYWIKKDTKKAKELIDEALKRVLEKSRFTYVVQELYEIKHIIEGSLK